MLSYKWCICIFVALFSAISSTTAQEQYVDEFDDNQIDIDEFDDNQIDVDEFDDNQIDVAKLDMATWLVVKQSGKKDFKTIQAAIDSIPSNNQKWTGIYIHKGIYREQVFIPRDKPFIYLKGAGKYLVTIIWNNPAPIDKSATFTSEADNIIAKHITFTNGYHYQTPAPRETALAARIRGDKSAFYECGFYGFQDTLWDDKGRHYFKSCTIEGGVDFIFGAGQSQYEDCTMSVVAVSNFKVFVENGIAAGYITAQGRETAGDSNGFVFKSGYIVGNGKTYLGRPWRDHARVLFYKTQMYDIIVPEGWQIWDKAGKESQLSLSEYDCSGPGAKSTGRVKWVKKMSDAEVKQLTDISFIDQDGWVKNALDIFAS